MACLEDCKSFSMTVYSSGALLACPLELLKIRAQVHVHGSLSYRDTVQELYRERGFRSMYKGFGATCLRDVPSYGSFFFILDYFERHYIYEEDSANVVSMKKMLCGGMAGMLNWGYSFPADLVKTTIQCHKG